jgi:hypothetical protein
MFFIIITQTSFKEIVDILDLQFGFFCQDFAIDRLTNRLIALLAKKINNRERLIDKDEK